MELFVESFFGVMSTICESLVFIFQVVLALWLYDHWVKGGKDA